MPSTISKDRRSRIIIRAIPSVLSFGLTIFRVSFCTCDKFYIDSVSFLVRVPLFGCIRFKAWQTSSICILGFKFVVTMFAFRLCIVFFLKMFPNRASLYLLPLHDDIFCTTSATTTLLSLSLDIFFKDFQSLLNLHRFWNVRPSFPNFSTILLNSVHNVQVLSTQSHVRLHQVARLLEPVFPITSMAEGTELCIYIFCRLLYSIVK